MAETAFEVLNEVGAIKIEDGNEIKFTVDSFKGHKYVSVRKYLKSEGYSGPTKSGITLSPEIVGKIDAALTTLPDDHTQIQDTELGKYAKKQGLSIICRVSTFMGSKGLDLRQWQEDDAYKGWTKKGIRLPVDKIKEIKLLFKQLAEYFKNNK